MILSVVVATAFFLVAPGVIERRMNRLESTELPAVSSQAQQLHDALQIGDMHSDTLM